MDVHPTKIEKHILTHFNYPENLVFQGCSSIIGMLMDVHPISGNLLQL